MLAGQKWKRFAGDLWATIRAWRDLTEVPERKSAYDSVCKYLSEELADSGLSLADPKIVERMRRRARKYYAEERAKKFEDEAPCQERAS